MRLRRERAEHRTDLTPRWRPHALMAPAPFHAGTAHAILTLRLSPKAWLNRSRSGLRQCEGVRP